MKHYISSKSESLPIFKNKFLDFFYKAHWSIPLIVFVPVIVGLIILSSVIYYVPILGIIGWVVCGLFVWTLIEYAIHRFVFHYHTTSCIGKRISWMIHGIHHDYPSDPLRLVIPPVFSIIFATMFYALFYIILGKTYVSSFMSGFLIGYLIYDMCHYAIHHFPIKTPYLSRIKTHHMAHHFHNPDRGFGVSSMLWDIILKTECNKELPTHCTTVEKNTTKN